MMVTSLLILTADSKRLVRYGLEFFSSGLVLFEIDILHKHIHRVKNHINDYVGYTKDHKLSEVEFC